MSSIIGSRMPPQSSCTTPREACTYYIHIYIHTYVCIYIYIVSFVNVVNTPTIITVTSISTAFTSKCLEEEEKENSLAATSGMEI